MPRRCGRWTASSATSWPARHCGPAPWMAGRSGSPEPKSVPSGGCTGPGPRRDGLCRGVRARLPGGAASAAGRHGTSGAGTGTGIGPTPRPTGASARGNGPRSGPRSSLGLGPGVAPGLDGGTGDAQRPSTDAVMCVDPPGCIPPPVLGRPVTTRGDGHRSHGLNIWATSSARGAALTVPAASRAPARLAGAIGRVQAACEHDLKRDPGRIGHRALKVALPLTPRSARNSHVLHRADAGRPRGRGAASHPGCSADWSRPRRCELWGRRQALASPLTLGPPSTKIHM